MNVLQGCVCMTCEHAKQKTGGGSCYCVKYGIIIGFGKLECRGYEREQIRCAENNAERDHICK